MSEQHTQEPWSNTTAAIRAVMKHVDHNGKTHRIETVIANFPISDDRKANMRRVVACVNACAGMQTEVLESLKVIDAVCSAVKYGRRYGELLSHLKFAVSILEKIPAMGTSAQVESMKAAIAKEGVL